MNVILSEPLRIVRKVVTRFRGLGSLIALGFLTLVPAVGHTQSALPNMWLYDPITFPDAMAYSPDGTLVALGGSGGAQIFKVATGAFVSCLPTSAGQVNSLAFSPDGKTLAVGGSENAYSPGPVLELWNVSTGKLIKTLASSAGIVDSVTFSPDGKSLADGGWSGILETWDISSGTRTSQMNTAESSVNSIEFSPDGAILAAGGFGESVALELWNVASGLLIRKLPSGATSVNAVSFSPDGKSLADGGYFDDPVTHDRSGTAEVFDVASGTLKSTLNTNSYIVDCVAYSPDGKTLAVGDWVTIAFNGSIELWNASTFSLMQTLQGDSHPEVHWIAYSPDGKSLASFGVEVSATSTTTTSVLDIFDTTTGEQTSTINPDPYNGSLSLAYSADGSTIALGGNKAFTGSGAGWIGLWDTTTHMLKGSINSSAAGGVNQVAFSPDGTILADCGPLNGGIVLELWNIAKGTLITTLPTSARNNMSSLAFSPDGTILADGGWITDTGGTTQGAVLELWDVKSGTLTANLKTAANGGITSLAFTPDGDKLVVCGTSYVNGYQIGVLEIWKVSTQTLWAEMPTSLFTLSAVAFSQDGNTFVDAGLRYFPNLNVSKAAMEMWSLTGYNFLSYLPVSTDANAPNTVVISSDGNVVFASTNLGIQAFDTVTYGLLATYSIGPVTQMALSPDGSQLAYTNPGNLLSVNTNPLNVLTTLASLSITPGTVESGGSTTGTVMLTQIAAPGGATVTLSSNNAIATVPASVVVASGAKTATFPITAGSVTSQVIPTVTASCGGVTKKQALIVNPTGVYWVAVVPNYVVGGNTTVGTVTLGGPAPAGGIAVSLTCSSLVSVPATVTVPAGQTTATFTAGTMSVSTTTAATITATLNGTSAMVTFEITPLALASLTLNPTTLPGGDNSTGTVTFSGPAPTGGLVVSLSCSDASVTVPKTVTVPAGQASATFLVSTTAATAEKSVTITATNGGVVEKATLTITAAALVSVSLNPASVNGGTSSTGTLTLSGPAPKGGLTATLQSSSTAVTLPHSVAISAGKLTATFTAKTIAVSTQKSVTVTAKLGTVTTTATLTVNAPVLSSLSLNPSALKGGKSSTGTVSISSIAPAGGAVITLTSSQTTVTLPKSITIPAGKTSATFTIHTKAVKSTTTATITATQGATSKAAVLTMS
jgi:WD40 repeat protein